MPDEKDRGFDGACFHIRAENESKFMRHYSGDWDNFTYSFTGKDTAWKFEASARGHTIVNLTRSGNGYLAIHADGKLYVPNNGEMSDASARDWKITWLDGEPHGGCPYFNRCLLAFKQATGWDEKTCNQYLEPKGDRCFCLACHTARGDRAVYRRGNPARDYISPVGFARIGVRQHKSPLLSSEG
jgi:hypothetical protein